MGSLRARRHVPVYIAHIITHTVLPNLGERHTTTAKSRVVLAGEYLVGEATRLYLDLTHTAQDIVLGKVH